jgi:hypothetical protein
LQHDVRLRADDLSLQENARKSGNPTRPKQPGVISRRAEKTGHIGEDSARASELIKALDRRLPDRLAIEILSPKQ